MRRVIGFVVFLCASVPPWFNFSFAQEKRFTGKHFSGEGDVAYVEMLETSRRMFEPDPRYMNLSMLYEPKWKRLGGRSDVEHVVDPE